MQNGTKNHKISPRKWFINAQVERWECSSEDMVCNIRIKTEESLRSLNQGQNTNTIAMKTFTCYLCYSMLL